MNMVPRSYGREEPEEHLSIQQSVFDPLCVERVLNHLDESRTIVLVTIIQAEGSTPRDVGAWMLLSSEGLEGTIGGGSLEYQAMERAQGMLGEAASSLATPHHRETLRWALGPSLGQCCGGAVELLFETINASSADGLRKLLRDIRMTTEIRDFVVLTPLSPTGEKRVIDRHSLRQMDRSSFVAQPLPGQNPAVHIFGAGHVAKALVKALAPLEFDVCVVDERAEVNDLRSDSPHVGTLTVHHVPDPEDAVADIPFSGLALVMTHDHQRDLKIVERCLRRADLKLIGLIGSRTKNYRFRHRLAEMGFPPAALDRLVCPIGLPGFKAKKPAEIAVSVAAQLVLVVQQGEAKADDVIEEQTDKQGVEFV